LELIFQFAYNPSYTAFVGLKRLVQRHLPVKVVNNDRVGDGNSGMLIVQRLEFFSRDFNLNDSVLTGETHAKK
jgi:hypothetical protein